MNYYEDFLAAMRREHIRASSRLLNIEYTTQERDDAGWLQIAILNQIDRIERRMAEAKEHEELMEELESRT